MTLITVSSLWIACDGSVTASTPAVPLKRPDDLGGVAQGDGRAPVGGRHLGLRGGLEDVGGQQLAGLGEVPGLVPVLAGLAARSCSWASWVPTASICWLVALGSIQTVTLVPRSRVPVALAAPWRSSRAAPTSDSDTATVRTAAIVISRLRHRFDAVSRTT